MKHLNNHFELIPIPQRVEQGVEHPNKIFEFIQQKVDQVVEQLKSSYELTNEE